jgi:hypothetical protein
MDGFISLSIKTHIFAILKKSGHLVISGYLAEKQLNFCLIIYENDRIYVDRIGRSSNPSIAEYRGIQTID